MNKLENFPADGIYYGLQTSIYHGARCDKSQDLKTQRVSKSLLHSFAKNPALWLTAEKKEPTDAMKWGSLVDCLLLTPQEFNEFYVVKGDFPDPNGHKDRVQALLDGVEIVPAKFDAFRTKEAKAWKAEQEAAGKVIAKPVELEAAKLDAHAIKSGKEIITSERYNTAVQAVKALSADDEAGPLFASAYSDKQVVLMVTMTDSATGLKVQVSAMLDFAPKAETIDGDALGDLKTMGRMETEQQIWTQCMELGYFKQAALSLDLYNFITGENRTRWILVIQRSTAPFDVIVKELTEDEIEHGRVAYQQDFALWCNCVNTGDFPDPRRSTKHFKQPAWAERKLSDALAWEGGEDA